jgi:hypothetical protein
MKLSFDRLNAGWVQVTLAADTGSDWTEVVSAVPTCPLLALAELACAAADGLAGRAELNLEPDRLTWTFDAGRLEVLRRSRSRAEVVVWGAAVSAPDLSRATWRGLRALESTFEPTEWPHPFPRDLVARLGSALRAGAREVR